MFYLYAALGLLASFLYRRLPRDHSHATSAPKTALGPSKSIVYKLAALFSMDAFAGGFVVQSLLALWLFQRFNLSLEAASIYFFCCKPVRRDVVSGGGMACRTHRSRQHHGVHAYPLQHLPDRRGVFL